MEVCEVVKIIEELSVSASILPRNVRATLEEIKKSFNCDVSNIPVRIDAALQRIEGLSTDPNVSMEGRSELWNLTSALESLNQR